MNTPLYKANPGESLEEFAKRIGAPIAQLRDQTDRLREAVKLGASILLGQINTQYDAGTVLALSLGEMERLYLKAISGASTEFMDSIHWNTNSLVTATIQQLLKASPQWGTPELADQLQAVFNDVVKKVYASDPKWLGVQAPTGGPAVDSTTLGSPSSGDSNGHTDPASNVAKP